MIRLREGIHEMAKAMSVLRRVWDIACEILEDRAYERYAERIRRQGREPVEAREYYTSQIERKYTRPSRCC